MINKCSKTLTRNGYNFKNLSIYGILKSQQIWSNIFSLKPLQGRFTLIQDKKNCMDQDGNPNHIKQIDNSTSFQNEAMQNDTFTEIMREKKEEQNILPNQTNMSKKSIQQNSIQSSAHGSTQNLVDPPVKVQTRNVFIKSALTKRLSKELLPIPEQHNNSTIHLQRNMSAEQPYERKQTLLRPKTMLEVEKKYEISSQMSKNKLPEAILQYITAKAKLKNEGLKVRKFTVTGKKLSKWGLSKQLQQKYDTRKCGICDLQQPSKEFQSMTKTCSHTFCHSCLHQYVIYKINAFITVECPNEDCHQTLDQESKLYLELPLQVRKKYKKLLQYEMVKEFPNRKMCPQEQCDGYVEVNEFIDTVCSVCKKKYCPKCLLLFHDGDCDSEQLQFFQGTLHYRQCSNCKNVIEKSTGCIHMTCRCGYQFCYLCGAKWRHSHTCENPEQERIPRERVQCCCCEVEAWDCEECCENCCNGFCNLLNDCCGCCCDGECCCGACHCQRGDACYCWVGLFQILLKGLILLVFLCVIFPFYISYVLFMGALWTLITLFIGSTMYTLEFICQLDDWRFYACLIFYPLAMWIGIIMAFREVFCQTYTQNITEMGSDICEAFTDLMSCD